MNSNIHQLPHQPIAPLSIEREWNNGHEIIVVEGVKYHADFFRMNVMPSDDVLYAVHKRDDGIVIVTVIRDVESAKKFFENAPLPSASPQMGERHLEGEERDEEKQNVI
jgi:hypothetical protein